MKTIIGKITIDILTSIYQPFWFAILLSIMTMFFYLYVKCPEGAGKGWKAAIRTWIDHFKRDREFRKKYILFFYITINVINLRKKAEIVIIYKIIISAF